MRKAVGPGFKSQTQIHTQKGEGREEIRRRRKEKRKTETSYAHFHQETV